MYNQKKFKISIFITARLKSTRLPFKAIKKIKGKAMLSHLIDRIKTAKEPEHIAICTSNYHQDNPLAEIANKERVDCFRGHPEDVLVRIKEAAIFYNTDIVISCTADNPFVDPIYIDKLVDYHIQGKYDFSKIDGLPFGTFAYAISKKALIKACEIKDAVDTEVWGGYFTESGLFKCGTMIVIDKKIRRPEIRLTVDYPEDFELIEKIYHFLYKNNRIFSLSEIIEIYDKNPDLKKLNENIVQKPGKKIKLKYKKTILDKK